MSAILQAVMVKALAQKTANAIFFLLSYLLVIVIKLAFIRTFFRVSVVAVATDISDLVAVSIEDLPVLGITSGVFPSEIAAVFVCHFFLLPIVYDVHASVFLKLILL